MSLVISSFKLVTGEEIIATLEGETLQGDAYILSSVSTLRPIQRGNSVQLTFFPWLMTNAGIDKLTLPKSAVVIKFAPDDETESEYLKAHSSLDLTSIMP